MWPCRAGRKGGQSDMPLWYLLLDWLSFNPGLHGMVLIGIGIMSLGLVLGLVGGPARGSGGVMYGMMGVGGALAAGAYLAANYYYF